jgi:hypothetical protein
MVAASRLILLPKNAVQACSCQMAKCLLGAPRTLEIPERRALMQWWADYTDECKELRTATKTEKAAV